SDTCQGVSRARESFRAGSIRPLPILDATRPLRTVFPRAASCRRLVVVVGKRRRSKASEPAGIASSLRLRLTSIANGIAERRGTFARHVQVALVLGHTIEHRQELFGSYDAFAIPRSLKQQQRLVDAQLVEPHSALQADAVLSALADL